MTKYKWSVDDDLVVYYYHHYKGSGLIRPTIIDISIIVGMPERSFEARIQNVVAVLTNNQHGLSNATKQTEQVVKLLELSRHNEPDFQSILRYLVNLILK